MQLDMHYYGTYAMARAAGLNPEVSKTIATAAQFVDDNAADRDVDFKDGGKFLTMATAHHLTSVDNLIKDDQRKVWVPFHFLPGGDGETYRERLLCTKNSSNAKKLLTFALGFSDRNYAPELIGAAAHIFADTFAHYDFSGISCRMNYLQNDKLSILNKASFSDELQQYILRGPKGFMHYVKKYCPEAIMSLFAEKASLGLGHGAACEHPDRPYIHWSFIREETGEKITHNNLEDFLEACEELHKFFSDFATIRPDLCTGVSMPFAQLKNDVRNVLSTPARMHGRIDSWQKACRSGAITGVSEEIPPYSDKGWNDERNMLNHTPHSHEAINHSAYRFYQATAQLRTFILRDLLPEQGIIVA